MSVHNRSTAGCTFGSRLNAPNPRYLSDLIDDYYRPTLQGSRRRIGIRSRSISPSSVQSRCSSNKRSSRANSSRSASTRASSRGKEKERTVLTSYPPWYNDEDIRRFELVRRIREEKSRIPKNSDKYNLVSGLTRPTSAGSRTSSRTSSRGGTPSKREQNMWEPTGTRGATKRDAQRTIQQLIQAQSRRQSVVFSDLPVKQTVSQKRPRTPASQDSEESSNSFPQGLAHPRLSTLKFYGKFLGSQAAPNRRTRHLQSLLDETTVFYAPNGDTVIFDKSSDSESPQYLDEEQLAHNAISGLMNLVSRDSSSEYRSAHRRFKQDHMQKFDYSTDGDDLIDLSKPGRTSFDDPALLRERFRQYTKQSHSLAGRRSVSDRKITFAQDQRRQMPTQVELQEASRRLKSYGTDHYYRE